MSIDQLNPADRSALIEAYLAVQRKYEERGLIPRLPTTILSRYRLAWEMLGAIHLGLLIGALSIAFNFLVITFLLHLPPS